MSYGTNGIWCNQECSWNCRVRSQNNSEVGVIRIVYGILHCLIDFGIAFIECSLCLARQSSQHWSTLVVWLECRFLDIEVGVSKPGNSMLCPWARRFIRIASVDSAVTWVPGGDNLVKVVQRYELFGGIAIKNHAFSFSYYGIRVVMFFFFTCLFRTNKSLAAI